VPRWIFDYYFAEISPAAAKPTRKEAPQRKGSGMKTAICDSVQRGLSARRMLRDVSRCARESRRTFIHRMFTRI